jgi:hypothetical protein
MKFFFSYELVVGRTFTRKATDRLKSLIRYKVAFTPP